MPLPTVTLSANRTSDHPWIYRRMVRRPKKRLAPGTLVEIRSGRGGFVGRGICNPKSEIALRVLTEDAGVELGPEFFADRLRAARSLREGVLGLGNVTDAYRLVHAEADGLSGLVVDRFAGTLVVKPYSAGYVKQLDWIVDGLREIYRDSRIAVRADETTAKREGFDAAEVNARFPATGRVTIRENTIRMLVNLEAGHKTGFFLDQRDNRAHFASLVRGMSVLDCFTYTGGFAISAMKAGAKSAVGVDLDEKALDVGRQNAKLNRVEVEFVHTDCFDHLRGLSERREGVDALVLAPAKLARGPAEIPRAKKAYGDMNRLACSVVRDGGLLLTCSCSGLVPEDEFLSIISRSAREAGCRLQLFRVAGAAPDHPVATNFPEGRYLKAVFARVVRCRGRPPAPSR
jgi:23S rRNA (cytosine1962-C5)-methyltransferase